MARPLRSSKKCTSNRGSSFSGSKFCSDQVRPASELWMMVLSWPTAHSCSPTKASRVSVDCTGTFSACVHCCPSSEVSTMPRSPAATNCRPVLMTSSNRALSASLACTAGRGWYASSWACTQRGKARKRNKNSLFNRIRSTPERGSRLPDSRLFGVSTGGESAPAAHSQCLRRVVTRLQLKEEIGHAVLVVEAVGQIASGLQIHMGQEDRKSTRLNSSHVAISYAVY